MFRARIWLAAGTVTVVLAALLTPRVATVVNNQAVYGTFDTSGPPPRVDYCGRRYFSTDRSMTADQVKADLVLNGLAGLSRIGTAPSGMPVVANVMPPAVRARYHTDVCTMEVWVQTGPDSYRPYVLSGGP